MTSIFEKVECLHQGPLDQNPVVNMASAFEKVEFLSLEAAGSKFSRGHGLCLQKGGVSSLGAVGSKSSGFHSLVHGRWMKIQQLRHPPLGRALACLACVSDIGLKSDILGIFVFIRQRGPINRSPLRLGFHRGSVVEGGPVLLFASQGLEEDSSE